MRWSLPVLFLLQTAFLWAGPVQQPKQPAAGPGGAEYHHASVQMTRLGTGGAEYWLFEPTEPAPKQAPFLIFLHGYSVMEPDGYMGWIEHLVRRGNVVVYPRYQENLRTLPAEYHPNVQAAIRSALETLKEPGHVAVDLQKVAVAGHSAGAVLAIQYAAKAGADGLPVPSAALLAEPGQGLKNGVSVLQLPDASQLPKDLKLVVAVGDKDSIVGDVSARRIWNASEAVKDRLFVTVTTDLHGEPHLRAGHLSPLSIDREEADAHDWYGWWRMFDAACDAAFAGHPLQLDPVMGTWSDGRPIQPLKIELPGKP